MKSLLGLTFALILLSTSCAKKYLTPGQPVLISELADPEIARLLQNQPAASFPVHVAIVRIQGPSYDNQRFQHGAPIQGAFSMVLTRDVWEEEALDRLSQLSGISQASPFNRMLLPLNYRGIKDLRLAAAKMRSDMLLVYTFDTQFLVDTKNYGPQNLITLGSLKNKEVKVVTTASAALYDVQTEYLYGLAEATARETRKSNIWRQKNELEALKRSTENHALEKLVAEIELLWHDVTETYAQETSSK